MSYIAPASLIAEYQRVREMLLASFPELADDEQALADTLEGETSLIDAAASLIRSALDDEAFEEACAKLAAEKRDRATRFGQRAMKQREAALALLQAADIPKLEQADFTASVGKSRSKVIIADEGALPEDFIRVARSPDKTAIGDALKDGKTVPGALLSNPEPTLTVRTR
ncbi:siphovirus Gp157 family protein [Kaistia sp. MMO-174]|uniref:siphovirus Gp157 family protein n=1 Tax=Kaistia sp. MMO-174 TaxID=3081256 RepID=UPI003016066D